MRTGHYDRYVSLQPPATAASSVGDNGGATAWTTVVGGWARIEPLSGRERLVGASTALGASMAVRITMPWSPLVAVALPTWRIVSGGLVYPIVSVGNKALQNDEIEFMCETGIKES